MSTLLKTVSISVVQFVFLVAKTLSQKNKSPNVSEKRLIILAIEMPDAEGSVIQDYLWLHKEFRANRLGYIASCFNNHYYINKTANCILREM